MGAQTNGQRLARKMFGLDCHKEGETEASSLSIARP